MKVIIGQIQQVLAPLKFRRRRHTFFADRNDVLWIVNIQKSIKSTKEALIVTVNLGILARSLAERTDGNSGHAEIWDCHWRSRLGHLMPENSDRWWRVASEEEASETAREVTLLLAEYGLPILEDLDSTDRLAALWETGKSPGLTAVQRDRYLSQLRGS